MNKISIIESLLVDHNYIDDSKIKEILNEQFTVCERNTVIRLLRFDQLGYTADFLSELRQCILIFRRGLRVPGRVLELCEKYRKRYGFIIDLDHRYVEIELKSMANHEDLSYIYEYSYRRKKETSFADASLLNYFGFDSYISLQQKLMIYNLKYLEAGETYLACIPTGSGKSLLWQYAVARGQFDKVTIVVVPTTALGIDHKKSDEEKLKKMPWIESIAYSSIEYANDDTQKKALCEKLKNGRHVILYISPEGLTNYEIRNALIEAATRKNISAVVIDEAHLVIDWGMQFRPEFQFLPALCEQLQEKSNNTINTVLLSATFSEEDHEVLSRLFGKNGLVEFRGDELRSEIEFFTHYCRFDNDRKKILTELIHQVPKPAIIYVGTLDQCKEYFDEIVNTGYRSAKIFTGKLSDIEKEEALNAWHENECSIMVATSAFGMGVDKADVRTVITAYTPENISRYYQEVGRAGRDGFSAMNFALFCPEFDSGIVRSYTDKKVISVDNLSARWDAMLNNQKNLSENIEANCMWLDTDTPPEHLKYDTTGAKNSEWNEDVIALLARAGVLQIVDVRRMYAKHHKFFRIKVQIENDMLHIIENKTALESYIVDFRNKERDTITQGKELMKDMFSAKTDECFSDFFKYEFYYAEPVCSGCPSCRRNGFDHFMTPGSIYSELPKERSIHKKHRYTSILSRCTDSVSFGAITYDTRIEEKDLTDLLCRMIINNVNIIVVDQTKDISMKKLSFVDKDDYMILTTEEFLRIPESCLWGTIAFFVNENNGTEIMGISSDFRNYRKDINQIIVVPRGYYDTHENRNLSDFTEYGYQLLMINKEEPIC